MGDKTPTPNERQKAWDAGRTERERDRKDPGAEGRHIIGGFDRPSDPTLKKDTNDGYKGKPPPTSGKH